MLTCESFDGALEKKQETVLVQCSINFIVYFNSVKKKRHQNNIFDAAFIFYLYNFKDFFTLKKKLFLA